MKRLILILALLAIPAAAFAQLGDILRKVDPSKIKKGAGVARAATKDFTEEEEVQIGRIVAARVLATYPLSDNAKMQKYVALVGETVAAYSSRPSLDWHFAVIDTPMVNAFSCPGGYIFITTAALSKIESEAELAAVLGHEVAHATEKHILKEVKRANVVGAGINLATPGDGGLSDELAKKISQVAYDKLFNSGIGRKEELDSDRIGVEIAGKAGYRPDAYLTFLRTLIGLAHEESSAFKQLGATHPKPDDRLTAVEASAKSTEGMLLADRWKKSRGR
jgi:predicted Zn-dependent protease